MSKKTIRTLSIALFLVVTLFYLSPLFLPKDIDRETETVRVKKPLPFWTEKMLKLGLDLRGGMEINLYVDLSDLPRSEHDQAVKAAVQIIQNRIDQFGVAEPSIQRMGDDKIVVQLPGVKDFQRARDLIGKTALLEFKLVAQPERSREVISRMDTWLAQNHENFEYLNVLRFETPRRTQMFADDSVDEPDDTQWYTDIMSYLIGSGTSGMGVGHTYRSLVTRLLADPDFQNAVPAGFEIALGRESSANVRADLPIYILEANTELTGRDLTNAETRFGGQNDLTNANRPYVSLRFNREGARIFERVTGANIRRQLAIVLDGIVYVAPVIQDRIRGGEAQITGGFTLEECNDIVIVLKAGNLPAPVSIGEERTVGPSLGSDSIRQGTQAGLIGLALVVVFMLIYYKLSGFIAVIALLLNTAFVFAALTFFEATLTLPGIAGMILTIGFAVDANILIFERIKEELRTGKTVRNAIDDGYARALTTILDANITTLIVAAVLYQFGSGPIRGFAVTLAIGIVASMFTAIFITKAIFDTFVGNKKRASLSI
jgi:protein-export membrane protein SecD